MNGNNKRWNAQCRNWVTRSSDWHWHGALGLGRARPILSCLSKDENQKHAGGNAQVAATVLASQRSVLSGPCGNSKLFYKQSWIRLPNVAVVRNTYVDRARLFVCFCHSSRKYDMGTIQPNGLPKGKGTSAAIRLMNEKLNRIPQANS
jgi:hypothetical protein